MLHIPQKLNSIIALLFIQNIFNLLKEKMSSFFVVLTKNNTTLSPGFHGQQFNNLQRAALLTSFWRHWFIMICRFLTSFWHHQINNLQRAALLTSLVHYDKILSNLIICSTAVGYGELCNPCGFNQSEMGKYFEWIIIHVNEILPCTQCIAIQCNTLHCIALQFNTM